MKKPYLESAKKFTPPENKQLDMKDKVFLSIVDKLFQHAFQGSVCGFIAAAMLYYTFSSEKVNQFNLNMWFLAITIGYLITITLNHFYKISRKILSRVKYFYYSFGLIFISFGIIWGSSAIYIMPQDTLAQCFLILFLFGNASALIQATIGNITIGVTTVILLFIPLIYWCLTQTNPHIIKMGYISFPLIIFLIYSQIVNTKVFKDAQKLRYQLDEKNKHLAELNEKLNVLNIALAEKAEENEYQAAHDPLTGLANRHSLYEFFKQAKNIVKRNDILIAIFFIDLDFFKQINDKLGHESGDQLLQFVSKQLNSCCRSSDVAARLGGDEFVIVFNNFNNINQIKDTADKLFDSLTQPFIINDTKINISASVGISIYPHDGEDIQTLLKYADTAMYKAKEKGKNNYEFYQDNTK